MTAEQIKETVARVLELDGLATKGPWDVRKEYFDREDEDDDADFEVFPHTDGLKKPADIGEWTALAECKSYEPNKLNADLIAYYRTAAPALAREVERLTAALTVAREALELYANPDSYFAFMFMADEPAGAFLGDFDEDHGGDYNRPMPGKAARAALNALNLPPAQPLTV